MSFDEPIMAILKFMGRHEEHAEEEKDACGC